MWLDKNIHAICERRLLLRICLGIQR